MGCKMAASDALNSQDGGFVTLGNTNIQDRGFDTSWSRWKMGKKPQGVSKRMQFRMMGMQNVT